MLNNYFLSSEERTSLHRSQGDRVRYGVRAIVFAFCCVLHIDLFAADTAQQAQTAERKAEVLERKAAVGEDAPLPKKSERITPSQAQAVDPVGEEPMDAAITCLARAVYWETRGEDLASMEAVANVVMNRLAQPDFPKTICGVVKQGGEKLDSCQFSWWCDGHADEAEEVGEYTIAKEVARRALNKQLPDRTDGALYFHHKNSMPKWAAKYIRTAQVGAHVFYRPRVDGKR